VSTAKPQHLI